jgi:hypothetical protein
MVQKICDTEVIQIIPESAKNSNEWKTHEKNKKVVTARQVGRVTGNMRRQSRGKGEERIIEYSLSRNSTIEVA